MAVYAHDDQFLKGSSSATHARKLSKLYKLALKRGCAIIGINNSSGIRLHEGVDAGVEFGEVFYLAVQASGVIPQISIVVGECAGGASYVPALTDIIIMIKDKSALFLTGPSVIQVATGERVTTQQIGGVDVHSKITGLAHFVVEDEKQAATLAREIYEFLPENNTASVAGHRTELPIEASRNGIDISSIIPKDPSEPYDVRDVVFSFADDEYLLEFHRDYAPNIVTGLVRIDGTTTGVIANQSLHRAGCLDVDASAKGARFVRFCDAFNLPIVTILDVPGYYPGLEQETGGIIGAGAKLLHAYCEATVPKIAIVLRKAYGGAQPTLCNRWATDLIYALPTAEISIMAPRAAVEVIFRRELSNSENPDETRRVRTQEYRAAHASAEYSARRGFIDGLIEPQHIRETIKNALAFLSTKINGRPWRKHSNIQL